MNQDNDSESVYWAREVLKVDAENSDAHFILAFAELESRSPNVPEAKRHLKVLEAQECPGDAPVLDPGPAGDRNR